MFVKYCPVCYKPFILLALLLALTTSAYRADVNRRFAPSNFSGKTTGTLLLKTASLGGGKTIAGIADSKTIAAGGYHSCAVTASGNVMCWGRNEHGQLGNGTKIDSRVPVTVKLSASGGPLINAIAVTAGLNHTCALTSTPDANHVLCWGANDRGQLGNGTITESAYPLAVNIDGVINVIGGAYHTCVIYDTPSSTTGKVTCWGYNNAGQLGTGNTLDVHFPPTAITGLDNVAALCANQTSTCAQSSGSASCWGNGDAYALTPPSTNVKIPTSINGAASGVTRLACGFDHHCAVIGDTLSAGCWGKNNYQQLGVNSVAADQQCLGNEICANTPVSVSDAESGSTLNAVQNISAGSYFTCALMSSTKVKCWGKNNYGQLGNNESSISHRYQADYVIRGDMTPPQILQDVIEISTGSQHACAMLSNGNIACWGDNRYGQLGDGTLTGKFYANPVTGFNARQYVISGKVTGKDGLGMAGVTISDGASLTTDTDGSGNYSFTISSQGAYNHTHRLTPTLSGSGFDPSYRDVIINDANNPNMNRSFNELADGCYAIGTAYTGNGTDPTPDKAKSANCSTNGEYVIGDPLTFTPYPGVGQQLKDWTGTDGANSAVLTVAGASTVTANYEAAPCYKLSTTVTPSNKATISASPLKSSTCSANGYYSAGTLITLNMTPASYYHLDYWSANVNAATNRLTMTVPVLPRTSIDVTATMDMYLRKGTHNDTNTSLVHTSAWLTQNGASYYGGGQHITKTKGSNMIFYFNGKQLKLYYTAGKTYGKLSIQIDTRAAVILNEYATATTYKRLWTSSLLSNGNHKVTLTYYSLNLLNTFTNLDGIVIQ